MIRKVWDKLTSFDVAEFIYGIIQIGIVILLILVVIGTIVSISVGPSSEERFTNDCTAFGFTEEQCRKEYDMRFLHGRGFLSITKESK